MSAFEGTAPYYARFRPAYPPELLERVADVARLRSERDRVLDMGAGTGHVAIPLAAYALEVVAVEPDEGMVAELRRRAAANVTVVATRMEDLGDVGTFALATAGRSIHWFASDELFARLAQITPRVALLAERTSDSEAQTAVLEIAREFRDDTGRPTRDRRTYAEILVGSPFSDVEQITVEADRTWTVDELIGFAYSTSFASPLRIGSRRAAFEAAVRERLEPHYRERVPVDALIGSRADRR